MAVPGAELHFRLGAHFLGRASHRGQREVPLTGDIQLDTRRASDLFKTRSARFAILETHEC
jgi:hypothetical protein